MLPVSLTFAGAFALIALWLGIRVTMVRRYDKVSIGDGGQPRVVARMRAQANFVEYTPFVMMLIFVLEIAGASRSWLWGVGIVYVLGRIAHPFGMDRPVPNPYRIAGALITWAVLLGLALWAIVLASHVPSAPAVHYL